MAAVKWQKGSDVTVSGLTTTLGADTSDASTDIDADADGYTHGDFHIDINGTFTVGDVILDVYLIRSVNAVFEDYDEAAAPDLPPEAYIGSVVAIGTGQNDAMIRGVELPPNDFRIVCHNRDGGALTNLAVKFTPYRLQVV